MNTVITILMLLTAVDLLFALTLEMDQRFNETVNSWQHQREIDTEREQCAWLVMKAISRGNVIDARSRFRIVAVSQTQDVSPDRQPEGPTANQAFLSQRSQDHQPSVPPESA